MCIIIYAISAYHLFWISIGSNVFHFDQLILLGIIIFVTMIADGLSKMKDLSTGLSIFMMLIYALPFILYMLTNPPNSVFIGNVYILIFYSFPWGLHCLLSGVSIFFNKKIQ